MTGRAGRVRFPRLPRRGLGLTREGVGAVVVIAAFFTIFFWPATLAGKLFVTGDSLVYSYPLRMAAWDAVRAGTLPLWTPLLLSGYPLLSMAQLGLGYPLTWPYLFLPGHWAEQLYVLAPYLLAPAFIYVYAREVGRSRPASLLAGLSFTFGGMMAGGIGSNGMLPNAVMWLPLMLVAAERSRKGRFLPCLIGATAAYSMSVLSGIGQGIVYSGVIALAYGSFLGLIPPGSSDEPGGSPFRPREWLRPRRWRPLAVCVGGVLLAAGVAAFQILETSRAQRRSIRSELSYEVFSGGAFTPLVTWKYLLTPFHNYNFEVTTYVAPLAVLMALAAVIAALRSPRANPRVFFWLGVAVLAWLLMLGDGTPLYRLAYRIPFVNRFRIPWRHAYEWTLAIAALSAYGWDLAGARVARGVKAGVRPRRGDDAIGVAALAGAALVCFGWRRAAQTPAAPGAAFTHTGLTEPGWLLWKAGFTLLILVAAYWGWRRVSPRWSGLVLSGAVALACFPEAYISVAHGWFPLARPASYFTGASPSARFLQQFPPEQNRIYTSIASVFQLDLPRGEPHNLSVLRGFHNAAGYEPLMPRRYSDAFGNDGLFGTPALSSPLDRNLIDPRSRVLDVLNAKLMVEYYGPPKTVEKFGARFAVDDNRVDVAPGTSVDLTGSAAAVDSLSFVTTLANTGSLADGETVAKVTLWGADGGVQERELKAGRDTSEWAYDNPSVRRSMRHARAPIYESQPRDGRGGVSAHRYWSRFALDRRAPVERVRIANVARQAQLIVIKATLYDAAGAASSLLTLRPPEHWRKIYDRDDVAIYHNGRALPRAWLVAQAEAVTGEEALRRIRGEGGEFDPSETALLEATPAALRGLPGGRLGADSWARVARHRHNRLVIETQADRPTVLVVSESHYPGWEATVDGRESSILTANYLLRGVLLPAGAHRVEMRYTAPAARAGAMISALTILGLSAAFGVSVWRRPGSLMAET